MGILLTRLGNPHQNTKIIHIAGTKGKGSVASLCASALQAAGYRVGLNTSPHLQDFEERIQLNGEPISPEALVRLVERVKPAVENINGLTTFELITALALFYFSEQRVDFVVLETGMGGRLDATNVVTPIVSIITSISYDHQEYLGNTLAEIAAEKAGIIKPGIPVVISPQTEESRRVLTQTAYQKGALLIETNVAFKTIFINHTLKGQSFWIWPAHEQAMMDNFLEGKTNPGWQPTRLNLRLLGKHQLENAATAYSALKTIESTGHPVPTSAIQSGFTSLTWPIRFEIVQEDPPVVLDGAHNEDSARRLREALDDYFPETPVIAIFGTSVGKDAAGMLTALKPRLSEVILTRSIHPRSAQPESLAETCTSLGLQYHIFQTVEEALAYGRESISNGKMLLATGSLFVAAGVRAAWQPSSLSSSLTTPTLAK